MFHQQHGGASPPPHLHTQNGKLLFLNYFYFVLMINRPFSIGHAGATVNQLLRRAAAAAALRRERNNSSHSDELSMKRHRPDNGIPGNNNSPDVINHMPQTTATDFSTIKHINNNNTPPIKDSDRNIDNNSGSYTFSFMAPEKLKLFLKNSLAQESHQTITTTIITITVRTVTASRPRLRTRTA